MENKYSIEIITDAISNKIYSIFGDDYNIENDEVKQGFETPSFFIKQINGSRNKRLKDRYRSELNFQIIGFATNNNSKQLSGMAEGLYGLEYMEVESGKFIRAYKMNHRIEDGVLQFFFDIKNFILERTEVENNMEEIDFKGGLKDNAK